MSEDHRGLQDPADAQDPSEDYVAPALTDLGSFDELTQFNTGGGPDAEATSAS
jgi:hypothetical protein